jgi:hypothetical protein
VTLERIAAWAILLTASIVAVAAAAGQSAAPNLASYASSADSLSAAVASGREPESSVSEVSGSAEKLGPTLPEDIKLPESFITDNAVTNWGKARKLRLFGWVDGG